MPVLRHARDRHDVLRPRLLRAEGRMEPDTRADGDKLWYLKHIAIFAGMTDAEMRRLAERTVMRSYARGMIIARPDDARDTIYLIKKGRVKLSRYSASGREQVLALLEQGEIFGERALGGHPSMYCEA